MHNLIKHQKTLATYQTDHQFHMRRLEKKEVEKKAKNKC